MIQLLRHPRIFVLVLATIVIALVTGQTTVHAVAYSTIPGGQSTAINLDKQCLSKYNAERKKSTNLKSITNKSAYNGIDWISLKGDTGKDTVYVNYGSTGNIDLRINHLDYICYVAITPGTNSLTSIDARMKTSQATDGVDRDPAPWTGFNNSPNRTFYGFGLYGLSASAGSIASYTNGAQVISPRNDSSRFWMVGTNFTYTPPKGGFTTDTTVTITANIARINQYYYRHDPTWGFEIGCVDSGGPWNDTWATKPKYDSLAKASESKWFTDQCGQRTLTLKLNIKINDYYGLTPSVNAGASTVEAGGTAKFTYSVDNAGNTTSADTDYAVREVIVPAGSTFDSPGIIDDALQPGEVCDSRYNADFSCVATALKSGTTTFPNGTKTLTSTGQNTTTANYPIGTRICRILVVSPPTQNASPSDRWSAPACVRVVAKPYFHVSGGDIYSGGDIISWNKDGSTGSYTGAGGQLAALATGNITSFVTGRLLSTGVGSGSGLAFANTTASGTKYGGSYTVTPRSVPDVETAGASNPGNSIAMGSLTEAVYYRANGDLELTAGTLAQDGAGNPISTTIVLDDGDLIISGDLMYAYNTIKQIPRLTVMVKNGNIYVRNNVSEIHGVFYTSGNFYSCAVGNANTVDLRTATGYTDCNSQLMVHGAVVADRFVLQRTHGTLSTPNQPAETFYYSPELWLTRYPADSDYPLEWSSYVTLPPIL